MKKFIYLSIVIATLSLSSFRSQDEIVLSKNIKNTKVSSQSIKNTKTYATFDSSVAGEVESAKPPQD